MLDLLQAGLDWGLTCAPACLHKTQISARTFVREPPTVSGSFSWPEVNVRQRDAPSGAFGFAHAGFQAVMENCMVGETGSRIVLLSGLDIQCWHLHILSRDRGVRADVCVPATI